VFFSRFDMVLPIAIMPIDYKAIDWFILHLVTYYSALKIITQIYIEKSLGKPKQQIT